MDSGILICYSARMPKHKPIRFFPPSGLEASKERITGFMEKHPIATSTAKAVLALAAIGGVLALFAVAPGLTRIVGRSAASVSKKQNKDRYRKLWKAFYAMKQKGVFEYMGEDKNGYQIYQLTEKGVSDVRKFTLETLEIKSATKWDGKWRLVIFDIPEKYKKARGALRDKLKEMNFFPLQKSAWVYPFPCEAEITFLKEVFNIRPFVELLTVEDLKCAKAVYHFQYILQDYF